MIYNEIGKTGMKVSALSFGASSLGGVFHNIREAEGIQAVYTAIENTSGLTVECVNVQVSGIAFEREHRKG